MKHDHALPRQLLVFSSELSTSVVWVAAGKGFKLFPADGISLVSCYLATELFFGFLIFFSTLFFLVIYYLL